MKETALNDLINTIADNHNLPAPASIETAATKSALRKKKRVDKDEIENEGVSRLEDETLDDTTAASDAPLQLAQAGSGGAAPAAAAPETGSAEAAATPASAEKTEDDDKGLYWLPLGGLALGALRLQRAAAERPRPLRQTTSSPD